MNIELRELALRHAQRARDRLRALDCEWRGAAGVQGGSDPYFQSDADALAWLAAQYESGWKAHERAWAKGAEIVRDLSSDLANRLAELPDDVRSLEIRIGMKSRVVHYTERRSAPTFFPATTDALRELERLAGVFSRWFGIEPGQATAAIMTNTLPETRGRSVVDDRLDLVLKTVLREMIEGGQRIPGPGRPGRESGVTAFWTEAMTRFNSALDPDPKFKKDHEAGHWTTTRSRFSALSRRDPEFKEEMGG